MVVERSLSGGGSSGAAHVGSVPEALPTFAALVGLFSGMDSLVLNQVSALAEGFLAITTFVGLLSMV